MGVLDHSIAVLKVLSPVLDMVPAIGGNLKGAAELACEICGMVETIKDNRERYAALLDKVAQLLEAITRELDHTELQRAQEMKGNVKELVRLLEEMRTAVRKRTGIDIDAPDTDSPPASGACGRISTWLCNTATDVRRMTADGDDLDQMEAKLQAVVQEFNLTTLMRTEMKLDAVKQLADSLMDRMSELQAGMHVALQDNSKRGKRSDRDADIELLNTLDPITSAAWNAGDVTTCTPSTREQILTDAMTWAGGSGGSCVFWMNGLAGTGKSTIARTLCWQLADRGLLGASFFVNRQDQARRDASNIVRTIAHQLAVHQHSFGEGLCAQLRKSPTSASRLLEIQIADLLISPGGALPAGNQTPLVIVIDALDECVTDSRGRPAGDLIMFLVRGLLALSGRLKLFLTSRAEPSIQRMFDQLSSGGTHTVMKLHELDKSMVQADIMTFLCRSFDQMRADMPKLDLAHWPSTQDLQKLVQLSGVLFVYASTIVRYVGSRRHSPRERLAQVLGQRRIGNMTTPYRSLDTLYMQVLEEAVGIRARSSDETQSELDDVDALCEQVRAVLAVVVLAQIPLEMGAVATLSGVGHDNTHLTLESLSALLLMEDGGPVRVFHPSFPDFMIDSDRCYEPRLYLAPTVAHGTLALRCLCVMNESLRYNICELSDPDVPNAEVFDLEMRLSEHVPDALRYACCFWMAHLVESGPPDRELGEELATFCREHLFHWLEVLSLLQFWTSLDSNALKAIEWCKKQDLGAHGTRITPLLQDTVEILQLYGVPIRSHALHCYHSAFVTMPSCLLLDTLAQQHVPDSLPRLLAPRAAHLGQEARVLYGHLSPVKAVAWSPDDTRIVSCSQGSSIRVWSAITFQALGHLEGHTDWVQSVVFSPDSARIISGSKDCTLRVWSTVAMEHLVTLRGHQKSVASVAVSPDGKRIVSGSWDHTVRVWCTSSFAELGCLSGDGQGILCVAFSTKGDRLISSCRDTVRVFNAFSLECLASLQATIHRVSMSPGLFRDVIFSHDDRHIFTGTSSGTVRIWCAITFRELGVLDQKMGSADWLSVSSNGAFVLSGDKDNGYIHVWNAGDFKEITRFHAHQRGVRSVAFSPDGTRFVSGGMDDTVRAWDTRMFDDNAVPLKSHTSDISSLTFSVDGIHMMSRLPEFGLPATVRVWNVRRFEELGQVECASLFVFSPTSARAVVQQEDMSLSLWNLSPLEKILDLSTLQSTGDRRVESISYSPEGTHIVCGMPRGTIEILNAVNLERLATFEAHSSPVLDVRFSTNGTRLVSRSASDGIRVWRADTLDRMGEIALHQGSVECMAVSPLGTHVVAALHDKTVRVWSTVTFEELTSLEFGSDGYLPATHVAFSPDGRCILARRFSKTRVWTCSQADNSVWTEVSLSGVQLPTDGNPGVFGVSLSETGWLRCWIHSQPRQIWLPHDRQGKRTWANFASRDEKVAVMSDIGVLTMLTFPVGKK